MKREDLIARAYTTFSDFEKPTRCLVHTDLEDAQFEAALRSVDRRDLNVEHIGTVAWGPIPSMSSQALAFFMPRLIELAVTDAVNSDGESFYLLLVNTPSEGPGQPRFELFGAKHRAAVAESLEFLCEYQEERLREEGWLEEARKAAGKWCGA